MCAAVETDDLTKIYSNGAEEVKAVDSLNITIDEGEVFGFLGPNGAGKTTTVQMLMQIVYPTKGTAQLLGKSLGDVDTKAEIGYLPEMFQFHTFLRAEEFLDFHARLYGMPTDERKKRVKEVLRLIGLEENSESRIRTFSKGMLQRIGIGQAIINNPKLLFLDEPTSALDPVGRRDVRDLILKLRDMGTTIFLNSHLLSEVEMVCNRVGIMNQGKLIKISDMQSLITPVPCVDIRIDGITEDLMTRINDLATEVVREDDKITVTLDSEDKIKELSRIISESGAALREFTPRQKPLEDHFMQTIEESLS